MTSAQNWPLTQKYACDITPLITVVWVILCSVLLRQNQRYILDRVICFWQGIVMHWKLNTRAPNDVFLINTLKSLFRLSRVLLDLDRCILSDARTSVLFSPNFRCNLTNYENENFFSPLFIAFLNPKTCAKNSLTWAVKVVKCEKLEFRKS